MTVFSRVSTSLLIGGVKIQPLVLTEVDDKLKSNPTILQLVEIGKMEISGATEADKEQNDKFSQQDLALIRKMGIEINDNSDYAMTMKDAEEKKEIYNMMLDDLKSKGKPAKGTMGYSTIEEMYNGENEDE